MNITIAQLIDYIVANRKKGAFCNYTRDQIYTLIEKAIECGGMVYATNDLDELNGVVCAIAYPDKQELFVHDILTTDKHVIRQFIAYFVTNFEGWKLQGMKRGRLLYYDTPKLCMKIMHKLERTK